MKIMAIDYGDARTGIAVSDPTCSITGTTTVIHQYSREKVAQEIKRLIAENDVGELVMGLPRNMDGTEGPRAALCREFGAYLAEVAGMQPVLWDERRTTLDAHRILSQNNFHGKRRKNTVDAVAASLILEGYLAFRNR